MNMWFKYDRTVGFCRVCGEMEHSVMSCNSALTFTPRFIEIEFMKTPFGYGGTARASTNHNPNLRSKLNVVVGVPSLSFSFPWHRYDKARSVVGVLQIPFICPTRNAKKPRRGSGARKVMLLGESSSASVIEQISPSNKSSYGETSSA
ncbi:hypothetical protein ACLB2K_067342 [Fragaria x ananassa]